LKVKEDEKYRIQFQFYVQREIVCGLKYFHRVSRLVTVAKEQYMIGSYPPSKDLVTFVTPWETAPSGKILGSTYYLLISGMLARGSYKVQSKIMDDDKHLYADFNWSLEIASSW
jgi:Rho GDP-dissociation inhibitor